MRSWARRRPSIRTARRATGGSAACRARSAGAIPAEVRRNYESGRYCRRCRKIASGRASRRRAGKRSAEERGGGESERGEG
eukprot:296484-Pleurochrysis_carterae.AAC.1